MAKIPDIGGATLAAPLPAYTQPAPAAPAPAAPAPFAPTPTVASTAPASNAAVSGGSQPLPSNTQPATQQQAASFANAGPNIKIGQDYTPDYMGLLQTNPEYMMALHIADIQHKGDVASAALVGGGGGGVVAPLPSWVTNAFDESDPYSKISQLKRAYEQGMFQLPRQLAGRGMFTSSELPYGQEQLGYTRSQEEHDLRQQVEDAQAAHAAAAANAAASSAEGAQRRALAQQQAETSYQVAQAQAALAAYHSVATDPVNRPLKSSTAYLVDGSADSYGQPIYSDPDGNLYTASGAPFYQAAGTSGGQDTGLMSLINSIFGTGQKAKATAPPPDVPGGAPLTDWRDDQLVDSGYSPGVAAEDVGSLYGGGSYDAGADPELQRILRELGLA